MKTTLIQSVLYFMCCWACTGLTAAHAEKITKAQAQQQLITAIRSGDLSTAEKLFSKVDIDKPLADGSSFLAWAVESQNHMMVEQLLLAGAQVNSEHSQANSFSPLILGCLYGNEKILSALLDAGAKPNTATSDGISALGICAGHAPTAIVQRLIDSGAAADMPDSNGQTPLMWAAANGKLDTIKVLLRSGAAVNSSTPKGLTPLLFAIKSRKLDAVLAMIDAGSDSLAATADGTTAIQLAMYQHAYDIAAHLIKTTPGLNLKATDRNGYAPLHAAVKANQPALVELLLAKSTDINALSSPSTVDWRYERNFKTADYEEPIKTPVLLAAEHGHLELMQYLIAQGADIELRSGDGNNLVLAASMSNRKDVLKHALDLVPNPNVQNDSGLTPLHLALFNTDGENLPQVLNLLKKKGARPEIQNSSGTSAADIGNNPEFENSALYVAVFN